MVLEICLTTPIIYEANYSLVMLFLLLVFFYALEESGCPSAKVSFLSVKKSSCKCSWQYHFLLYVLSERLIDTRPDNWP